MQAFADLKARQPKSIALNAQVDAPLADGALLSEIMPNVRSLQDAHETIDPIASPGGTVKKAHQRQAFALSMYPDFVKAQPLLMADKWRAVALDVGKISKA